MDGKSLDLAEDKRQLRESKGILLRQGADHIEVETAISELFGAW